MQKPILVLLVLAIVALLFLALERPSDEDAALEEGSSESSAAASDSQRAESRRQDAEQEDRKRSSVPALRYSGSEPGESASPKPTPLTGRELAKNYPVVMSRIQEGLQAENGAAIRKCIANIASEASVRFDVTVNVVIDGEVGSVDSIEFPEPPDALSDAHKECLTDVMTSLSFDGMDVAFEGPVNYPFFAIKRPPDKDAQTVE